MDDMGANSLPLQIFKSLVGGLRLLIWCPENHLSAGTLEGTNEELKNELRGTALVRKKNYNAIINRPGAGWHLIDILSTKPLRCRICRTTDPKTQNPILKFRMLCIRWRFFFRQHAGYKMYLILKVYWNVSWMRTNNLRLQYSVQSLFKNHPNYC